MTRTEEEADRVAAYADQYLNLAAARLGDGYHYASLPLCVIDAVYSIGVLYEGVEAEVRGEVIITKLSNAPIHWPVAKRLLPGRLPSGPFPVAPSLGPGRDIETLCLRPSGRSELVTLE
jgi:hypothetical protein